MVEYICSNCGKSFLGYNQRKKNKTICCSIECNADLHRNRTTNMTCKMCGKAFYIKKSHIGKTKNACCSRKCGAELKKITMAGEKNHQYGLRGNLNDSFKSGEFITTWGYRKILLDWKNDHHYILEHRLVAEKYLLTDDNSVDINGEMHLKEECVVHHKDKNRLNNNVENLYVFPNENIHAIYHGKSVYKGWSLYQFIEYYNNILLPTYCNDEWIYNKYIVEDKSILWISTYTQLSWSTINARLVKLNIKKETV